MLARVDSSETRPAAAGQRRQEMLLLLGVGGLLLEEQRGSYICENLGAGL